MAKVFLVDDDPLLVRMYQKKLELDGYEVRTASNGDQALAEVESVKPDLILLDIMMPKKNGLEVLEELKKNSNTKAIPVIMLTNVSSKDANTEKALEIGAISYLVKSNYTPKEVVMKVKEILEASHSDVPDVKVIIKDDSKN